MATFQEYCDRCSNEVEQAIVAWHRGKYISGIQSRALLRYNYPLGGFNIDDSLFSFLLSFNFMPRDLKKIGEDKYCGGYKLLRDEICLNGFYCSYENKFKKCEITERERVFTQMKEDLLEYCMNIIWNTCEFGGDKDVVID